MNIIPIIIVKMLCIIKFFSCSRLKTIVTKINFLIVYKNFIISMLMDFFSPWLLRILEHFSLKKCSKIFYALRILYFFSIQEKGRRSFHS